MRLEGVRKFALSLPETNEQPHFNYTSFRVRGKIFLTAPPDGSALHVFVGETERETALALEPDQVEKLLWGGRVMGLRVHLSAARPAFVKRLIEQAWRNKAPRALLAGHASFD